MITMPAFEESRKRQHADFIELRARLAPASDIKVEMDDRQHSAVADSDTPSCGITSVWI